MQSHFRVKPNFRWFLGCLVCFRLSCGFDNKKHLQFLLCKQNLQCEVQVGLPSHPYPAAVRAVSHHNSYPAVLPDQPQYDDFMSGKQGLKRKINHNTHILGKPSKLEHGKTWQKVQKTWETFWEQAGLHQSQNP